MFDRVSKGFALMRLLVCLLFIQYIVSVKKCLITRIHVHTLSKLHRPSD